MVKGSHMTGFEFTVDTPFNYDVTHTMMSNVYRGLLLLSFNVQHKTINECGLDKR